MKLVREMTFPVLGSMDINVNNGLLVRVRVGTKHWIRVLDRQTGDLINEIPSMCEHRQKEGFVVNKHPGHQDYVLETCLRCEEIRANNIDTAKSFPVCQGKFIRMCDGPDGSLLIGDRCYKLFKLEWDAEQRETQLNYIRQFHKDPGKTFLRFCYVECHDILLCTLETKEKGTYDEIIATKLESGSTVWRLFGPVDGCLIKPVCITCDTDGNAYVSDRRNNRIMKINALTGEVLSILLMEEGSRDIIWSMRWSNTEPNFTCHLKGINGISTYSVQDQSET